MSNPVLHFKHARSYLPIGPTVLGWLFFDRIGVPGWTWGALGVVAAILWAAAIYGLCNQEMRSPKWEDADA